MDMLVPRSVNPSILVGPEKSSETSLSSGTESLPGIRWTPDFHVALVSITESTAPENPRNLMESLGKN